MTATLMSVENKLWGAGTVMDAVTEAFKVLSIVERSPRPKGFKSNMPRPLLEFSDLVCREDGAKYQMPVPRSAPPGYAISRMEQVLQITDLPAGGYVYGGWFQAPPLLAYPDQRRMLIMACIYKAKKISTRKLCKKEKWNLSTFQRGRDKAAVILAEQLNRWEIPAWL